MMFLLHKNKGLLYDVSWQGILGTAKVIRIVLMDNIGQSEPNLMQIALEELPLESAVKDTLAFSCRN